MSFFKIAGTVLKSLFSKPFTVGYPFEPRVYIPGTRGSIAITIADCIFCGICQRKCPTAAITVAREQKAWEIDRFRCVACNACVEGCPKKCLAMNTAYSPVSNEKGTELYHA